MLLSENVIMIYNKRLPYFRFSNRNNGSLTNMIWYYDLESRYK